MKHMSVHDIKYLLTHRYLYSIDDRTPMPNISSALQPHVPSPLTNCLDLFINASDVWERQSDPFMYVSIPV